MALITAPLSPLSNSWNKRVGSTKRRSAPAARTSSSLPSSRLLSAQTNLNDLPSPVEPRWWVKANLTFGSQPITQTRWALTIKSPMVFSLEQVPSWVARASWIPSWCALCNKLNLATMQTFRTPPPSPPLPLPSTIALETFSPHQFITKTSISHKLLWPIKFNVQWLINMAWGVAAPAAISPLTTG